MAVDVGTAAREALALIAEHADQDDEPRAFFLAVASVMSAMAICMTTPFQHRGATADLMSSSIWQGLDVYGVTDAEDKA